MENSENLGFAVPEICNQNKQTDRCDNHNTPLPFLDRAGISFNVSRSTQQVALHSHCPTQPNKTVLPRHFGSVNWKWLGSCLDCYRLNSDRPTQQDSSRWAVWNAIIRLQIRPLCPIGLPVWRRYYKSTSGCGGSVAEWLACWTQVQYGPGSNRSWGAVG